ncbi:MAG: hypothetical protein AAGD06_08760 [Acidobacteriota bacterium]
MTREWVRTGRLPLLGCLLALALAGCELDEGPRRPPYPQLDPRGAFPELRPDTRKADNGVDGADGADGTEEDWLEGACGGDPADPRQWLVGGSLAVNLPDPSWRALAGPGAGHRLLRIEDGGDVVAWAYFEDMGGNDGPEGLRRFLYRVDRALVKPPLPPPPPPTPPQEVAGEDPLSPAVAPPADPAGDPPAAPDSPVADLSASAPPQAETAQGSIPEPQRTGEPGDPSAQKPTIEPPPVSVADAVGAAGEALGDAVDAADAALERLLPRDGYTSLPGSFTGWRWVGRCRNDPTLPTLRLARTAGTWRHEGVSDAAYMVVGSASLGRGVGVYLAVVAVYPPDNPKALDLASMLASFHAGHGRGGFQPGTDPEVFTEWAESFGLSAL